jgi:hypothetical protein
MLNWDDWFGENEFVLRYSKFPDVEGQISGYKYEAIDKAKAIADYSKTEVEIYQRLGAKLISVEKVYPSILEEGKGE